MFTLQSKLAAASTYKTSKIFIPHQLSGSYSSRSPNKPQFWHQGLEPFLSLVFPSTFVSINIIDSLNMCKRHQVEDTNGQWTEGFTDCMKKSCPSSVAYDPEDLSLSSRSLGYRAYRSSSSANSSSIQQSKKSTASSKVSTNKKKADSR